MLSTNRSFGLPRLHPFCVILTCRVGVTFDFQEKIEHMECVISLQCHRKRRVSARTAVMLSECMHICVTTECPMLCIYPFNARAFSFPTVRAVSSELTPTFFDRVSSISDTPRTFTCASTLNYTWIILCLPCSDLEHRRTLWLLPNLVPYRSNCKGGLPCEPVMSGLPKSTNCARIGAIELL